MHVKSLPSSLIVSTLPPVQPALQLSLYDGIGRLNECDLLDHVRHSDFGVFFKHAGHQAIAAYVVNALQQHQSLGSVRVHSTDPHPVSH